MPDLNVSPGGGPPNIPSSFWVGLGTFITTGLGVITWMRANRDRARKLESERIDARISGAVRPMIDEVMGAIQSVEDKQQLRHEQNLERFATLEAQMQIVMERRGRPRE